MNKNLEIIIKKISLDKGKTINKLLGLKIVSMEECLKCLMELNDAKTIINFYTYVEGVNARIIVDKIISMKDAEHIFYLLKLIEGVDKEKLVAALIETEDMWYIFKAVTEIKNIDKTKLYEYILSTNSIEHIYKLANIMPDTPYSKIQDKIIASKSSNYIYFFAKNFYQKEGVSIEKLTNAILQSNNSGDIYTFARDIPTNRIMEFAKRIVELNDSEDIYNFAVFINGAPIEILADGIIATGDFAKIRDFANITNAPVEKITDYVISTGDSEKIFWYAYHVEKADKEKLGHEILKSSSTLDIYRFATIENISQELKELLVDRIIELQEAEYIYRTTVYVKDVSYQKLFRALLKTKDIFYIYKFIMYIFNIKLKNLTEKEVQVEESISNTSDLQEESIEELDEEGKLALLEYFIKGDDDNKILDNEEAFKDLFRDDDMVLGLRKKGFDSVENK